MTEHDIRRKIYALELKPNTKLTLLGVLDIVNWQTWSSQCSSKDVSKRMSMKETSVRRAFTELVQLGLISRVAERRETSDGKVHHHRAVTRIHIKAIMSSQTLAHNELTPLAHNELTPLAHNELTPLAHSELTPLAHKEPPLAHSELTPLAHSELTPTLIMSYNTTEGTTEEYNRETTEETQQTSQPDDDAQTVDADDAVEVDDSSLPPQLSHLSEFQLGLLREHAADNECSLIEAYEYSQRIQRNSETKLNWRREREKSGMLNRPTAAYRPKPLY
jgi:hypothetical protein